AESVGVQVRRFGGLGDFSTVSIRGSAAGQVQIYLDGVPLSRAENEVVNLNDLPLDAIDHVEVYRGTTPLGFAQSGPGGVVNARARRPGDTPLTGRACRAAPSTPARSTSPGRLPSGHGSTSPSRTTWGAPATSASSTTSARRRIRPTIAKRRGSTTPS